MKLPGSNKLRVPTLSKREIFLAVLLLLSSTFFLCYNYIIKPQLENINRLKSELQTQQEELDFRINNGWNDIYSLENDCNQLEEALDNIYREVPNIKNEPLVLVDLYRLAEKNKVTAETVTFSELKEVEDEEYKTYTVTTEAAGPNVNIYNFIEDVENYSRLNRISSIEIEPQNDRYSICKLSVEFYVLPEVEPDPLDYPFMQGEYGKDLPYQVFGIYEEEEAQSSRVSGISGVNNTATGGGGESSSPQGNGSTGTQSGRSYARK